MSTPSYQEIEAAFSKFHPGKHCQQRGGLGGIAKRVKRVLYLGLTAWVFFMPSLAVSGPYRVKRGDTLFSIAHRNGVTVRELKAANHIQDVNLIHRGQVLIIPEGHVIIAGGVLPSPPQPRTGTPIWANDPARIQALRDGLDEGWVVTRNRDVDSQKLFVHESQTGGSLRGLRYLIRESPDGRTWTVYLPQETAVGQTRYGRMVGVISKPTNVNIGGCTCM